MVFIWNVFQINGKNSAFLEYIPNDDKIKAREVNNMVEKRYVARTEYLDFLMKNARKSPYFNAGMDRAKLT